LSSRVTLRGIYKTIIPDFLSELKEAVGGCETLLDVGCGNNSIVNKLPKEIYSVGVDLHKPSIEKSKEQGIHNEYYEIDVLDIEKQFLSKSFDCVLALDLIEHLTKKEGLNLLEMMETIARKKVIVFTPNGFLPQGEYDNNPNQIHKSGWEVEEMKMQGYDIIGINGWKPLRGEYANIKFRPRWFWGIVSDITQFFIRNHPEYAFQILCVKKGYSSSL
jgi:predicted TPR repeat methyltransferase